MVAKKEEETAQLAPASGAGIGKVFAEGLIADPSFKKELIAVAMRGLRAQTPRRWDKDLREWVQDDDMRVQIQTLALILAHMEGEPIKRVVHQHLGAPAMDPFQTMQDSPAAREAMRRLLDKAERGEAVGMAAAKKLKAIKETAVEVD